MNPYKKRDLRKFIESIPQDEVVRQTQLQDEENTRVYNEFVEGIKIGKCFLCGASMDSVNKSKPCFHWFTYPKGIRKVNFEKYLAKPLSYYRLDCYFRWLSNYEKPLGNINDLKEETSPSSYAETTYKYRNLEWSLSIGHTDKEGHKNSAVGSMPHYHIQMLVDNKIFIRFNDFHVKFTDEDLFNFELIEQAGDKIEIGHYNGYGIGILENPEYLKIVDDHLTASDDFETAPIRRQTMIEMPEGKTMSGEDIQRAIKESKKTGIPIGKILRDQFKEAKVVTILTPGESVPEKKKRSGKK